MMDEETQLAVKRGAYYLDEQYPNWATAINLDTLEMDDCASCVVGQALGDYSVAIAMAAGVKPYTEAANNWAVEQGFDLPEEVFFGNESYANQQYRELENLWTEQVKERLS